MIQYAAILYDVILDLGHTEWILRGRNKFPRFNSSIDLLYEIILNKSLFYIKIHSHLLYKLEIPINQKTVYKLNFSLWSYLIFVVLSGLIEFDSSMNLCDNRTDWHLVLRSLHEMICVCISLYQACTEHSQTCVVTNACHTQVM